jgi:hypothetical protein
MRINIGSIIQGGMILIILVPGKGRLQRGKRKRKKRKKHIRKGKLLREKRKGKGRKERET